jgi:hypothetical protein
VRPCCIAAFSIKCPMGIHTGGPHLVARAGPRGRRLTRSRSSLDRNDGSFPRSESVASGLSTLAARARVLTSPSASAPT